MTWWKAGQSKSLWGDISLAISKQLLCVFHRDEPFIATAYRISGAQSDHRVSSVPNLLYLRIMEDTVLLRAFPRSVPCNNPVTVFCRKLIWPHDMVVSCEVSHRKSVFPNLIQSVHFTTDGNQSRCRNISKIKRQGRNLSLSTYVCVIFIFYHFTLISRHLFSLCHYVNLRLDKWISGCDVAYLK